MWITVFEFIAAKSPHSIKGLVVGLFFFFCDHFCDCFCDAVIDCHLTILLIHRFSVLHKHVFTNLFDKYHSFEAFGIGCF